MAKHEKKEAGNAQAQGHHGNTAKHNQTQPKHAGAGSAKHGHTSNSKWENTSSKTDKLGKEEEEEETSAHKKY